MAPPHKRRRLEDSMNSTSVDDVMRSEDMYSSSHDIEELSSTPTSPALRAAPQHIEEVHLQIHQQAISALDSHHRLHRRQQGTAVSSSADSTLQVSVIASVNLGGSTTALSTTSATTASSGASSFVATSTTTAISSPTSPSSVLSIPITSGESTTTSATPSASLSASSPAPTSASTTSTSESSTTASVPSTESGFIGLSPIGASATISDTNSNGTITASPTATGGTGGSSVNLTTSALIVVANGTTYTTKSTLELAAQTGGTASGSSRHSSGTTALGALAYVATLSDGKLATVTRSSQSYVTTFPDGQVSTIAPASGSFIVTTLSNGATSTFFETVGPSQTDAAASQGTVTSTMMVGGGQAGSGYTPTSSASTSTSSASLSGNSNNDNPTPPAGTIAGGVVGGAAGLAVILLIAMLFLRWYRRKSQLGHQALPPNSGMSSDADQSRGPGMAERAGIMPLMGAVPALFRHQNRSHDGSTEHEPGSERGFTRVSGRKLPSSFSPGMDMNPNNPLSDLNQSNLSSTSFYRDSAGFYGGEGGSHNNNSSSGREELTLSPGPQRRPTVHAGGPYTMAAPQQQPGSPSRTIGTVASFDRSDTPTSLDPNRGSRFTEEV